MSPTTETDRRQFLKQTAAVAATFSAGARTPAAETGPLPIIDTHQHLWDLDRFRLPWLKSAPSLDKSFLPEDYRKATEGLNVVKAIYMEVDVDPAQHAGEAKWVVDLIRSGKTPTVAAVIGGRPASEGFRDYIARFKDQPEIKGVRQVLHGPSTPPGYCLAPDFIKGVRLLGENGLRFDICVPMAELPNAVELVKACPGTSFILDHCGNADVRARDRSDWVRSIHKLAERTHVVCKVSGIVATTQGKPWRPDDLAPIVNSVLSGFGPDRVMFGGDWPVCTLGATFKRWVEALRTIVRDRPEEEQRKLFHDNAARVYRLT